MDSGRSYSLKELIRFDGERESRILVAFRGIVYDVTDCPKWHTGLHEGQHFPGQDLTAELEKEAPHGTEVFLHDCARQVGFIQNEAE
jgi:predicted heme/steroid binding protein